jgi:hypothetical protein
VPLLLVPLLLVPLLLVPPPALALALLLLQLPVLLPARLLVGGQLAPPLVPVLVPVPVLVSVPVPRPALRALLQLAQRAAAVSSLHSPWALELMLPLGRPPRPSGNDGPVRRLREGPERPGKPYRERGLSSLHRGAWRRRERGSGAHLLTWESR